MLYKCIPRDAAFKMPISALPAATCTARPYDYCICTYTLPSAHKWVINTEVFHTLHIRFLSIGQSCPCSRHVPRNTWSLAFGGADLGRARERFLPPRQYTIAADSRKTEQPLVMQLYLNTSSIRSSYKVDSVTEVRADDTLTAWYHCPSLHNFPVLDAL